MDIRGSTDAIRHQLIAGLGYDQFEFRKGLGTREAIEATRVLAEMST